MHGHTVFVAGFYRQIYGLATEYAMVDVHTNTSSQISIGPCSPAGLFNIEHLRNRALGAQDLTGIETTGRGSRGITHSDVSRGVS